MQFHLLISAMELTLATPFVSKRGLTLVIEFLFDHHYSISFLMYCS